MAVQRFKDKDGKWVVIGGGAGGGLQYIVERKVYLTKLEIESEVEEREISEAERAYNIETLNMALDGKAVVLVDEGLILPLFASASSDNIGDSWVAFATDVADMLVYVWLDGKGNAECGVEFMQLGLLNTEQRTFYPTRTEVNPVGVGEDFDNEITDDERAYNIETFNLAENGNVVIVDFGFVMPCVSMTTNPDSPEEDYARFGLVTEEEIWRLDIFRNGDAIASVTDKELLSHMEKNALRVWLPKSELTIEQREDNIRVYNLIARNKGYVIAHAVTHLYSSPFEAYTTEPVYYTLFQDGGENEESAVIFSIDRQEKFTETINGVERQLVSVRTDFYRLFANGGVAPHTFNM